MNIVSPRLNVGLPIIAVPPAQPPQPYLRHGCSQCCIARDNERMSGRGRVLGIDIMSCHLARKNRAPAVLQMLCFIVWFEGRGEGSEDTLTSYPLPLTSHLRLSHNLSRSDIAFAVDGADDVHTASEQRYVERIFAAYVGYHCA